MIKVRNAKKSFYQCESCARSGEDGQTQVREITIEVEGSGQGNLIKLCRDCFNVLKEKF